MALTPPNTDTWMVLARFGTEGNLIWGTYLGGTGQETVASLAPADSGILYVTAITKSLSGIATPGTHQPTHGGGLYGDDAALIKLKDETASGITPVFGFTEHSSFTLQPNPATEVTLLSGRSQKALGALQCTLYDATGSAVWQKRVEAGTSFSEPVNISKLPAGNYLLRITGRHTAQTLKLIKQ